MHLIHGRFEFLLPRFVRHGRNDQILSVRIDLKGSAGGDMEKIKNGLLDDKGHAVAVMREMFDHGLVPPVTPMYLQCSTLWPPCQTNRKPDTRTTLRQAQDFALTALVPHPAGTAEKRCEQVPQHHGAKKSIDVT